MVLSASVDKTWGRPWCRLWPTGGQIEKKKKNAEDCRKSFNVRTVSPTTFFRCFGGHGLISINLPIGQGIKEQNAGKTQLWANIITTSPTIA